MRPRSAIGRPGPLSAGLGRVPAPRPRHPQPRPALLLLLPGNGVGYWQTSVREMLNRGGEKDGADGPRPIGRGHLKGNHDDGDCRAVPRSGETFHPDTRFIRQFEYSYPKRDSRSRGRAKPRFFHKSILPTCLDSLASRY